MSNPFKRYIELIKSPSHSRTLTILVTIIIILTIPLTVYIAQRQQETRQQASETDNYYCAFACPPGQGASGFNCTNEGDICTGSTQQCCKRTTSTPTNRYTCKDKTTNTCIIDNDYGDYTSEADCKADCKTTTTPTESCTNYSTLTSCQLCASRTPGATCKIVNGQYQCCVKSDVQYYYFCDTNTNTCRASLNGPNKDGCTVGLNNNPCPSTTNIDGVCGTDLNSCSKGTFSDTADSTTEYKWDCKGSGTGSTAHCTKTKEATGGTEKTVVCHTCSSTKYCGSQTWEQPVGKDKCDVSYAISGTIQNNQVVCSCTDGTADTCEGFDANTIDTQCGVKETTNNKCTRCSDVYKYCSVSYDKTNGVCGNGDSATGKEYSLACNACGSFGDDKGYCPGPNGTQISTSQCSTTSFNCSGNISIAGKDYDLQCGTSATACSAGYTPVTSGLVSFDPTNTTCKPNACCYKEVTTSTCDTTTVTRGDCTNPTPNTCSSGNGQRSITQNIISNGQCTQQITYEACDYGDNCSTGYTCNNGVCTRNTVATNTPAPTSPPSGGNTQLAFTVGLDGIGSAGDHANPNDSSGSNKNPIQACRTKPVHVEVFDSSNALKSNITSATMTFNATSGRYAAIVDLGSNIANAPHTVKIKTDSHLRKLIPGIQNFIKGTNNMAQVDLAAGDINADNSINILDYNILNSCSIYSKDQSVCNGNQNFNSWSDLDCTGTVNEYDYNLFIRDFSVQNGD